MQGGAGHRPRHRRLTMAQGTVTVTIDGPEQLRAAFHQLGYRSRDLHQAWGQIGAAIAHTAHGGVPWATGTLAGSIRAGKAKTKAIVRAGGARVPYAGVINYGWPGHNIEAQPFLTDALEAERDPALATIDHEIDRIIREVGLD